MAVVFASPTAIAEGDSMVAEIDFLLNAVVTSDCVFIRNGKDHDATAAREHLQMKRKRGRKYYDSTEQFIDRIASKSSWSGEPYRIRCGDIEQDASTWFTSVLGSYRSRITTAPEANR